MDGPAGNTKKEMPKRARNPPKKIRCYEPDPGSPRDDLDGRFVFLTFEDGYTAKIFNACDILSKDDKPIACFRDLKPGEEVLARWSDNKFYNATVDFIGTTDKAVDVKKGTKKDMKKRDAAAQRFYNLPSLSQAGQSTSTQHHPNTVDHNVIQPPTAWPVYQPPPTKSSPSTQPHHRPPPTKSSPSTQPHHRPPPTKSSPSTQPHHRPPPTKSSPSTQPHHRPPPTKSSPSTQPHHQPPPIKPSPPTQPHHWPPPIESSLPTQPHHQPPPIESSPSTQPQHLPPPIESSPPTQPQHWPVTAWPLYQLPVTQSLPQTHPYYQHPPIQPLDQYAPTLSPITHCSSDSQYPNLHQPHTVLPTPSDLSQQQPVLVDLDQQRQPPAPTVTAKENFLQMLYSPNTHKNPAVLGDQSQASTSEHENSSSSSGTSEHENSSSSSGTSEHENSSSSTADTIIIERDPIPDYGEPILRPPESTEDRSWKPFGACKAEVAKLMEEKDNLQDVLCGISGNHIEALKSFLDKVEQIQPQTGVWAPKNRSGKQELYPESGLFLPSTRLAAIHAEARKDCLRLFHLLFDEFFNAEECQNAVAFGKHGKVPDGKTVLDKSKVDGIVTYIMHCSTLDGWTPVEKSKIKKAFINKCRVRGRNTV